MKDIILAVDIGGTNTKIGWVDRDGLILERAHLKTTEFPAFGDIVKEIATLSKSIIDSQDNDYLLKGIGVGAPNGNFYQGTIEFAPNLAWTGIIPMARTFEDVLGVPAFLTNDANAAAYGEMIFGGARKMKDFIVITLGTGVGSGFVVNGQLMYGHDGFAGEFGHITAEDEGRMCGCGRRGCLETYASAKGIQTTAQELLKTFPEIESCLRDKEFTAKDITESARLNDPIALKAFEELAEVLGKKLADIVAITSPEAIFLFGGLAQAGPILFEPVKSHMEDHLLKIFKNKIELLPSELPGADAAILGAAAIAWAEIASRE